MNKLEIITKIIKIILLISIILFGISFFQKGKLPDKEDVLEQLYQEPLQTETDAAPFKTERGGIVYDISPLYDYELYGLIVSYHHSKSWLDYYHGRWKDFINIKDICVIWGDNIKTEVYKQMKFKSGSWTCYSEFKSGVDWRMYSKFKNSCGSNNHLLSDKEAINKAVMSAKKGDQIYLKGYLVEYSHSDGAWRRGTSISRTDNKCETIFVTDFQILKKANPLWHSIYTNTKYSIIGCLVLLIIFFFIPIFKLSTKIK